MTHQARTIDLVAPSGYPDSEVVGRAMERLRAQGHRLENVSAAHRRYQRFGGTDGERAADLNRLADSSRPLPDIVLAVRGGYGATRILHGLDYEGLQRRLQDQPIAIVGHSDFTAIQMALHAQCGLTTFGGPMLGPDFGAEVASDFTLQHFWSTVRAPQSTASWSTNDTVELDVAGPLWGGNLAMLCSLIGTPYFPDIDGGILFVEDVTEPPFRIERLLYQLHLSGVLGRQRALLLGDFTQCKPSGYDNGYDLDQGFAQLRSVVDIPVIDGLPFGHEPKKFTLPFGAPARLRTGGGRAQLNFSGYPHLVR